MLQVKLMKNHLRWDWGKSWRNLVLVLPVWCLALLKTLLLLCEAMPMRQFALNCLFIHWKHNQLHQEGSGPYCILAMGRSFRGGTIEYFSKYCALSCLPGKENFVILFFLFHSTGLNKNMLYFSSSTLLNAFHKINIIDSCFCMESVASSLGSW